ncbi:hypothetical protein JCM10213_003644 [Rhodosporidiobolus nylandii]
MCQLHGPPVLPRVVLERILLLAWPAGSKDDPADDVKQAQADILAWSLVCREWGDVILALKYALLAMRWWKDETQIGDVCMPIAVKHIVMLKMSCVPDDWLKLDLHHFAPLLIWLDLDLVGDLSHGVRNLRICCKLERLGLKCEESHRGALQDVLDTIPHLPHLEHLSLERFDSLAPPPASPASSLPTLTHLHLGGLRGPHLGRVLGAAFRPSTLPSLTHLALSALDSHLTHAYILLFHDTLSDLSFELVQAGRGVVTRLLPDTTFPSLRNLRFRLTVPGDPLAYLKELGSLVSGFVLPPGRLPRLVKLDSLSLVEPDTWTDDEATVALAEIHRLGRVDLPSRATPLKQLLWLGLPPEKRKSARHELSTIAASFLMVYAFEVAQTYGTDKLFAGLEPLPVEEVLRKGKELRKAKSDEEEKTRIAQ